MEEEEKLHEGGRMGGRQLNEDESDHKATLRYDLEKEMREIFEDFFKEPKPSTTVFNYGRKLMALEMKYEKEGLSWKEITEVRRDIVNGKNGRTKTNIN